MAKNDGNTENEQQSLYGDLNKACMVDDYDKVLKLADKIIQRYPDEFKAFHCKVVALIQLGNIDEAYKSIMKISPIEKDLIFEKAYCEYRLNRLDESIATIKTADPNDSRMQELLAQILYKQELYEEALEKYKVLTHNIKDAYEDERSVNLSATVTAMAQWSSKRKDFPNVVESLFEVILNKACYLAAIGQYEAALTKLKEAEEMCIRTSEEQDMTPIQIDEELCAIKVQWAYCLQRMDKVSEASVIYHDILKKRCGEGHALAVAANNVVCINKDQNIFDSRKKIKIIMGDSCRQKLISKQREAMDVNNLLFLYYSNQGDAVKNNTAEFMSYSPDCIRAALIKAAQLSKEKQLTQAAKFLEDYLELIEKTAVDDESLMKVQLSLAQLYLAQGCISKCNEILSDVPLAYRYRSGVISTRVCLFLLLEEKQSIVDTFDVALEWYRSEAAVLKRKDKDAILERYQSLLRVAAAFCLRHRMPEQAAKYYEVLLQRLPNDQSALASLIAAYSRFDKERAEKTSILLKDDNSLPEVDVDSLESAFIFGTKHMKKLLKGSGGEMTPSSKTHGDKIDTSGGHELKKKKKKKKPKLPKNMDPNKLPDPERWLPKRERSYYKGRKRDKRANIFRGPQGATGGAADLDASKKSSVPPTPSAEPVKKQPAQGQQQQQKSKPSNSSSNKKANKNKKKGGKW